MGAALRRSERVLGDSKRQLSGSELKARCSMMMAGQVQIYE